MFMNNWPLLTKIYKICTLINIPDSIALQQGPVVRNPFSLNGACYICSK